MMILLQTKWKLTTMFGLVVVLLIGNTAYATNPADNFYWSDGVPTLSCSDGGNNKGGVVIDGKKVAIDLPTCEEAKKNQVKVLVNGQYLHTIFGSGAEPYSEDGRTMIPLKALADAFGFEVNWEQSEQKITLKNDKKSIILHVGKSEMLVDGEKVMLEKAAPTVKNNVTFLPVRPLAELLGVKVDWDAATRTATFANETAEQSSES